MHQEDKIKDLKTQWAEEFGKDILHDPADDLQKSAFDIKANLKVITQAKIENPNSKKFTIRTWLYPFAAAASLALAFWIWQVQFASSSNEIDWSVLDEIDAIALQAEIEGDLIYEYAEANTPLLNEMQSMDLNNDALEEWLNNDKDLILWLD